MPADNNGSKRDLRSEKVDQQVIGGFCSPSGAERHSIILSVVQTARKQRKNILDRLTELIGSPRPIQARHSLGPARAE